MSDPVEVEEEEEQTIPTPTNPVLQPDDPAYSTPISDVLLLGQYTVPNRKDTAKRSSIPFGAIIQPLGALEVSPPFLGRPPIVCAACGAYFNKYSIVVSTNGEWRCNFCGGRQAHRGALDASALPELGQFVYDFAETDGFVSKSPASATGEASQGRSLPPVVFLVDSNLHHLEMPNVVKAIEATVQALPGSTPVGLFSFGPNVSVWDLSRPEVASSYTIPASASPSPANVSAVLSRQAQYLVKASDVMPTLSGVLKGLASVAPPPPSRGQRFKKDSAGPPPRKVRRGLGAALELTLCLLGVAPTTGNGGNASDASMSLGGVGGRVLAMLSGAPNHGPGALTDSIEIAPNAESSMNDRSALYLDELGLVSLSHNVSIDLFCAGPRTFHLPILHRLVLPNGGKVILHKDFGAEFVEDLLTSAFRITGRDGSICIRNSENIAVSHLIGPAMEEGQLRARRDIIDSEAWISYDLAKFSLKDQGHYCKMTGVSPTNTFAIYYELQQDLPAQDEVFLQIVVKWTSTSGERLVRVVTRSIATTDNVSTFVSSVDADVCGVLLAKRAVLMARKMSHTAHTDPAVFDYLDQSVREIVSKCGVQDPDNRQAIQIPPNLISLPKKVFLVERGPLLGSILGTVDDVDYVRCLFLYATYEESLQLIEPKLYVFKQSLSWEMTELPLEDLALQSDHCLLLDHFTDIYIWSGSDLVDAQFDSVREYASQIAHQNVHLANRFPRPHFMSFKDGESDSRWLLSRLIPSHKDSIADQKQSFPQLNDLTPQQYSALMSRFYATDDLSFKQYYGKLFS